MQEVVAAGRDSNLLSITFQKPQRRGNREVKKTRGEGGRCQRDRVLGLDREGFYLLLRLIALILGSSAA